MSSTTTTTTGDISEKFGPVPDIDGRDHVVETFKYPHIEEGAFVGVSHATTLANGEPAFREDITMRGVEAVQLGLALIAAGRRAIELDL